MGAKFEMEEPLLLFCLGDTRHDWRLLQLVDRSMCAVYRQLKKKEMDRVLVSVQSEVDGNKAECVRNELYALFDVWVGWGEQHRKLGREIMIDKLYEGGLRLEIKVRVAGDDGGLVCIVVWGDLRVERALGGKANVARNAMVRVLARVLHARGRWPLAARPRSDPQHVQL